MKNTVLTVYMLLTFSFSWSQTIAERPASEERAEVKNVILLIGDGMGLAQIQAGMMSSKKNLNLERFTTIGLAKTSSADDLITDSGAAATAIACGIKTYNGAIGVDEKKRPCKNILELSRDLGKSTGLIATSVITHATPASFATHVESRYSYEEIAAGFLDSEVELIIGGGQNHFDSRKDNKVLTTEFGSKGYEVVTDVAQLPKVFPDRILGLFNQSDMPTILEGRKDMLPNSTSYALGMLSRNEQGFFLIAEGSQIDWGGHDMDIQYLITEFLDFDVAIGHALDFAAADGNTLVIVTADHETGGLSINGPDLLKEQSDAHFSTSGHTPIMVPVFAFGPGSHEFSGIYENTEIFHKMKRLMGL